MREFSFENKGTRIYCYAWDEAVDPIGIVLFAHDMGDYAKRQDEFAAIMNANGYIVVAPDLRGHGRTCGGYDHRGETEGDTFFDSVDDLHKLASYAITQYHLPLLLVGVGYGSYLAQAYLYKHPDTLRGAVLIGSSYMNTLGSFLGNVIVSTQIGFVDAKNNAGFICRFLTDKYDKQFEHEKLRYGWLTRDKVEVQTYVADPFCGAQFIHSMGFMQALFRGAAKNCYANRLAKIPDAMPILLLSGDSDPVGKNGIGVRKLYEIYIGHGKKNTQIKLYPEARHDLLREINRDEVYLDLLNFAHQCMGV